MTTSVKAPLYTVLSNSGRCGIVDTSVGMSVGYIFVLALRNLSLFLSFFFFFFFLFVLTLFCFAFFFGFLYQVCSLK